MIPFESNSRKCMLMSSNKVQIRGYRSKGGGCRGVRREG